MANQKKVEAEEQEPQAQATPEDGSAVSLDPRAIKILLDAVDVATRRGAFGIQEMGNISSAYNHTNEAIEKIVKAQQPQSGNTTNQGEIK